MIGLLFDPAAEAEVRDTLLPLLADRTAQAVPYRCSALPDWPEGMIVLTYPWPGNGPSVCSRIHD
jgi:hypothetical protein